MPHIPTPFQPMTLQNGSRAERFSITWAVFFAIVALECAESARAVDQSAAVQLSRRYLAEEDPARRSSLLAQLADYNGEIDPVLRSLDQRTCKSVAPGYHGDKHFVSPSLQKRHPDDLLFFVVPKGYKVDRPTGLIIFLHGGGRTTSRQAPQATLQFPSADEPSHSGRCGDMLAATDMITVGPSAPWNPESPYRWCLRGADEYLEDVILECKTRFNIDPNRVFLLGHSMGGFGAYHHALRQPDRFAAIVANSGSWSLGYWPVIRGTPLCIVQAERDAVRDHRWHYTDVEYGRWTDKILSREKLDHVYREHEGRHGIGHGRQKIAEYFASAGNLRRDPYYPHVTLASPEGFKEFCCRAVKHNRWLTLNETTEGELKYDALISHSNGDFDSWRLEHRRTNHSGAIIDAVNRGGNTIAVTTQNVARFTLWLHPRMFDVSQPVVVTINGEPAFNGPIRPSLATALESYQRRHDWGMIYPVKIELSVPTEQRPSAEANGNELPNSIHRTAERAHQSSSGNADDLAKAETTFPVGDGLVLRGYSNRHSIMHPEKVHYVVVMIHGILRNPDNYYRPARDVLARKSLSTKVALLSVGFDDLASAPKNVPHLALFDSRWKHGGFGGPDPDAANTKLSSFSAMDRVVAELAKSYPQLKRITLIGHSAGAQFVDRYSVVSSIAATMPKVAFRFVAMAPSSVLYPSELRPQGGDRESLSFSAPTRFGDYDQYPYGLGPSNLFERLIVNPASQRARLAEKLIRRDIVFAVGVEDTTSAWLDSSRSANLQGANRYQRLKNFVEFLKAKYPSTTNRLLPIAGVGHNSQRLIKSKEMCEFFSDR